MAFASDRPTRACAAKPETGVPVWRETAIELDAPPTAKKRSAVYVAVPAIDVKLVVRCHGFVPKSPPMTALRKLVGAVEPISVSELIFWMTPLSVPMICEASAFAPVEASNGTGIVIPL